MLQGYGVRVDLVGSTFISKQGNHTNGQGAFVRVAAVK